MYTSNSSTSLRILIFSLLTILAVLPAYAQNIPDAKPKQSTRIGFGYQVQEFQLLNQNLASDCNCDEGASLRDRSLQGGYFGLQVPVKSRWLVDFNLGYSDGRIMNDLKQYADADFILVKLGANYLFSSPDAKIRPYLNIAAQYYSRPDKDLKGLPVGIGLNARIKQNTYLSVQTAYDLGLGENLAQSLITGISLHFPLVKTKASSTDNKSADNKKVVVLKPAEKPVEKPVQPAATAQQGALAQVPVAKTHPAETAPVQTQPVAKPAAELALELYKVVYFDTDKSDLNRPGTLNTLIQVVNFMNANPQTKAYLSGHTDLRASIAYNIELSKKRVLSVHQFLLEAGISPERLVVNYFGKSKPATTNTAEDALLSNRRTEIWVK